MNIDFPIDFVFTWVDGSNPQFIAEKDKYAPKGFLAKYRSANSLYRNLNTLAYAVNSVIKNAPWANKIFIVTNGQKPDNIINDPRIRYIFHEQFFKFPSHLPTFNSEAIEANLCFISELSEHFIYFNDDTFLGRKASPEDFFLPDGRYYLFLHNHPLPKYNWLNRLIFFNQIYLCNLMKTADVFQSVFPEHSLKPFVKWTGAFCNLVHQARPFRKSAIQYLWDHECLSKEIEEASSSRFRTASDIFALFLAGLAAIETKKAKVSFFCEEIFEYVTDKTVHDKTIYEVISKLRPLLFCINDNVTHQHEAFSKNLMEFLKDYYN